MALAEAWAVWQRTVNRCFVQEKDSKRAPKLSCNCSSVSPSAKQTDKNPARAFSGQNIPNTVSLPVNPSPSYSSLSPSTKWRLRLQTNCAYHKDLMDEQFNPVEVNDMETLKVKVEEDLGCEVLKNENELYFDNESCWIGAERNNTPWWRTADTDELASFVAQRSLEHIENCDLPRPQITRSCAHPHRPASSCQKLSVSAEGLLVSSLDKSLRDNIPTHESLPETHSPDNNATRAQLIMQALRHSQTRARKAETAAKQARAENEHIINLLFQQASHLLACKQWLHLLQLENKHLQFVNNEIQSRSVSIVFPAALPQTTREVHKSRHESNKRAEHCYPRCDFSKCAVVVALGLGLAGAGFLLGWTVGWVLPTW